jgi:hypothetical protein
MKNLKPYLALMSLIIVLFFAIREKHNIEKIINNLLYQEEIKQYNNKEEKEFREIKAYSYTI